MELTRGGLIGYFHIFTVAHFHNSTIIAPSIDRERERDLSLIYVCRHLVGADICLRHVFGPDRADDSRRARVEAALRLVYLLAGGAERAQLRGIPHADGQLVFAILGEIGDVGDDRHVRAFVRDVYLVMSHENLGAEVDGVKMQDDALARTLRRREGAPVPDVFVFLRQPPDSRKRRLDGKRHEDLLHLPFLRHVRRLRDFRDLPAPFAVQALPVRAYHLRTRIFAPGVLRRNLLSKRRHHRRQQYGR